MLGFIFRIWEMPLNETRYEKYLTEIQQVLTRTETISLILVFVGSKGLRVCVCVCMQCDLFRGQVCLQLSQRRPNDFTSRGPPSQRETEEERDGGIRGGEGV